MRCNGVPWQSQAMMPWSESPPAMRVLAWAQLHTTRMNGRSQLHQFGCYGCLTIEVLVDGGAAPVSMAATAHCPGTWSNCLTAHGTDGIAELC